MAPNAIQIVRFENDKIKTPEMHLGAKLQKKSMDGIGCWAITSEECIKSAVSTIKASIAERISFGPLELDCVLMPFQFHLKSSDHPSLIVNASSTHQSQLFCLFPFSQLDADSVL